MIHQKHNQQEMCHQQQPIEVVHRISAAEEFSQDLEEKKSTKSLLQYRYKIETICIIIYLPVSTMNKSCQM